MEESVSKKRTSMEEEMVSLISTAEMQSEGSDSNSNSNNPDQLNKRARHDYLDSFVRFKGVVLQQNGHWGAQIYANHQRIWLGTFKSEKAAAMAYDSAALKLRSGDDSHRNFPWTNVTIQEPNFQDLYTTDAVLNMIKDGSYESVFSDYIRSQSPNMTKDSTHFKERDGPIDQGGLLYHQLFQKELTPSDVGKLNRLVIPKKHATKYLPQIPAASSAEGNENGVDDIQLVLYDNSLRSWKFRYCYWKSSQSYVFTRGWNRFVKEKKLKAKDVITFYTCEYLEGLTDVKAFCMIDVEHGGGGGGGDGDEEEDRPKIVEKMDLQLGLGECFSCGLDEEERKGKGAKDEEVATEKKGVRLFGVQIG